MTAMPTMTEHHLQEIAERIEAVRASSAAIRSINSLGAASVSQSIIDALEAIGNTVLMLPEEFTEFYNEIPWREMSEWSKPAIAFHNFNLLILTKSLSILEEAEFEICRHAYPQTTIEQEVLRAGDISLEQHIQAVRSNQARANTLLWAIGFLVLSRIGLFSVFDLKLSGWELGIYLSFSIPMILIFWETQRDMLGYYFYPAEPSQYYTQIHYFDIARWGRKENISNSIKILSRQKFRHRLQLITWLVAFIASIFATIYL